MNAEVARGHWFFIFNNVPDLPEVLISGREEIWLRYIFSSWCYNPQLFSSEEIADMCELILSLEPCAETADRWYLAKARLLPMVEIAR